jgi:hypothetical protein
MFVAGQRVRVNVTVTGTLTSGSVRVGNGVQNPGLPLVSNTTQDYEITLTSHPEGVRQVLFDSLACSADVSIAVNKVTVLGALTIPVAQPIPVANDATFIGGNPGRVVGASYVGESKTFVVTYDTASSAGGGTLFLGGDIFDSTKHVIETIEQTTTGTPTTSIGHATGSLTTYKASGALYTGVNPVTLVTRKLSGNQIWIYSSTTDTVRTTITGHVTK